MRTETEGLDDEKRLGATVVCAIEDGTRGQTQGEPELVTRGTTTYSVPSHPDPSEISIQRDHQKSAIGKAAKQSDKQLDTNPVVENIE